MTIQKLVQRENYVVAASHCGLDWSLDERIERKAGRITLGTGFSFVDNRRDLDFGFARKDAALRCAARIRSIKGVRARVRDVRPGRTD